VKPTVRQRLRYAFDNTMARGTSALVGYLAIATAVLIALGAVAVLVGGFVPPNGRHSLIGSIFTTLTHAIDPGTLANDTARWPFLAAMLVVTIGGLFVFSALIGVLATGLDRRLEELRKGRSLVLEHGHTLILGWSDQVFTILSELEVGKADEQRPAVVILADEDKVEMEDRIRTRVHGRHHLRVVCRSGNPIDLADLELASPREAASIIVLAPPGEDPDSQVIKTVLALTRSSAHRDAHYRIVAEITDPANLDTARLVGGDEAIFVDKRRTISRLIVQAARQSGISAVITDLLDFGGDEIYMRADPQLEGRRFGEAVLAYERCSVIGLIGPGGRIELNPRGDREIEAGARVIAIAEDATMLAAGSRSGASVDEAAIAAAPLPSRRIERSLILGWNSRGTSVVSELASFMRPGAAITIIADVGGVDEAVERECTALGGCRVGFRRASTTDRRVLESAEADTYDHVIVLCYSDTLDVQEADARTLVTILHLRDIADRRGTRLAIVSEMLDDRNRELAETADIDDVIVSDRLTSLMLAQLSENPHLENVFSELLVAAGSEVYLRPIDGYLAAGREASYATAVEAALRRGEVAIGYWRNGGEATRRVRDGVRLNPPKSELFAPAAGDCLIVLAED
jgi:voltage-gated potassium channel Kch